jgi:hypothetical protein
VQEGTWGTVPHLGEKMGERCDDNMEHDDDEEDGYDDVAESQGNQARGFLARCLPIPLSRGFTVLASGEILPSLIRLGRVSS